jgi:hypothetical protein
MLILTSLDRYCSSSQSRRLHLRSTIRTARKIILISTILSAIYMSPMLIIYYGNDISNKCILKSNTLIFTYICSQVFLYCILTPVLMLIFGLLTTNNIRRQSTRAIPFRVSLRGRRTEGQLTRMFIRQVSVPLVYKHHL